VIFANKASFNTCSSAKVLLATINLFLLNPDKQFVQHQDSCVLLHCYPFDLQKPYMQTICSQLSTRIFFMLAKGHIGIVYCRYFWVRRFSQPSNIIRIIFLFISISFKDSISKTLFNSKILLYI
jgi:hypothetical protein